MSPRRFTQWPKSAPIDTARRWVCFLIYWRYTSVTHPEALSLLHLRRTSRRFQGCRLIALRRMVPSQSRCSEQQCYCGGTHNWAPNEELY